MAEKELHNALTNRDKRLNLQSDINCLEKMKTLAQSEKMKLEMHKLDILNQLRTYESMLRDVIAGKTVNPENYFNRPCVQPEIVAGEGILHTNVETDVDKINKEHIDIGLNTLQCLVNGEIFISDEELEDGHNDFEDEDTDN